MESIIRNLTTRHDPYKDKRLAWSSVERTDNAIVRKLPRCYGIHLICLCHSCSRIFRRANPTHAETRGIMKRAPLDPIPQPPEKPRPS